MGLELRAFQNILIDPRDSNVVYVSAIGPLWNAGGDRGLYKTTDGGKTWKAVLTVSPDTGVPTWRWIPRTPTCSMPRPTSGGAPLDSSLVAARRAASTRPPTAAAKWTKLTKGLPTVEIGRIGIGINWKNRRPFMRS